MTHHIIDYNLKRPVHVSELQEWNDKTIFDLGFTNLGLWLGKVYDGDDGYVLRSWIAESSIRLGELGEGDLCYYTVLAEVRLSEEVTMIYLISTWTELLELARELTPMMSIMMEDIKPQDDTKEKI